MYIQDQVHYDNLDDNILSFYRAISVDSIHLELRGGGRLQNQRSAVARVWRIRRWHSGFVRGRIVRRRLRGRGRWWNPMV